MVVVVAFFDEEEPVFFEPLFPFDVTLWVEVLIFSDDSLGLSIKEEISLEFSILLETKSDVSSDEIKFEVSSDEIEIAEDKFFELEREESSAKFELEAIFSSDPQAEIVTRIMHKDKVSATAFAEEYFCLQRVLKNALILLFIFPPMSVLV